MMTMLQGTRGTKKVLVIQADCLMTPETIENVRTKIISQIEEGCVIIPSGFTFKAIDEIDYSKVEEVDI